MIDIENTGRSWTVNVEGSETGIFLFRSIVFWKFEKVLNVLDHSFNVILTVFLHVIFLVVYIAHELLC